MSEHLTRPATAREIDTAAPAEPVHRGALSRALRGNRSQGGWERSGNHGRSPVRSAALVCSLVRGFICGNMEMPWWRGCGCIPGGQGVAGSNPAVPTVNQVFSNIVTPHKSQQKSHLVVQWPFGLAAAPIMYPGVLPGHPSNQRSQGSRPAKGSKITEPPRTCTATSAAGTGGHCPRRTGSLQCGRSPGHTSG